MRSPWLHSPTVDSALILSPPFLATAAVWLFRDRLDGTANVPLWAWVVFVLCIDVAHVYSTLFRTYFHPEERERRATLLTLVPIAAWFGGVLLYSMSALLFWRVLAYVAVFHFVRQQYGFMMFYSRYESRERRWIDRTLIYLAAGYPVVYWHSHLPRNFHWFVDGDFVTGLPPWTATVTLAAYATFLVLYLGNEIARYRRDGAVSVPKQLVLLGTAVSWYLGIVALNGDMAFTITNVVSHGLPYVGLIWIYGRRETRRNPELRSTVGPKLARFFALPLVPLFLGVLLTFAYLEEGLWDGLVWRDHTAAFEFFRHLPRVMDHATLSWLVPLLSLPQITHYILDGFLWRVRDAGTDWARPA